MTQVQAELQATLQGVIDQLLLQSSLAPELTPTIQATLASPKVAQHGDFAITCAMQLARPLKQSPQALGETIKAQLAATASFQKWVSSLEIAGPGFINLRLNPAAKQTTVHEILHATDRFGFADTTAAPASSATTAPSTPKRVLVEFVSANPTGPLHVGHARQATLGDAICNLLATQGQSVHREFYYNDAGVQIDTLAKSVQLRAKGFAPGDACWPTEPDNPLSRGFYNGDYIADIANDFLAKKIVSFTDALGKHSLIASGNTEDINNVRAFAVAYLRREQNLDLAALGVRFDHFYLESSLYTSGRVSAVVERLIAQGKTYEADGALWLKTTEYDDDKDRVMRKSNQANSDAASYTYFVPDIAYHQAKWERGFTKAVNIQGMDHHGTIARVRAGLQGLGVGIAKGYPDYVLHTMVRVVKNGQEVKISKRAGSYVTLRDLIEWTSVDATRFFLLSRKPDTEYTFDVDLAVKKNNENPVYYVQYAHARICSILRTFSETGGNLDDIPSADLTPLSSVAAGALMILLAKYPAMLKQAASDLAPHDITFYLRELAAQYHSYYDEERILVPELPLRLARVALIAATAQVLKNGLALLGVSAPEKM